MSVCAFGAEGENEKPYLDVFSTLIGTRVAEESVHDVAGVLVNLLDHGHSSLHWQVCENNQLVILEEVAQEIVQTWSLCHSPSMVLVPLGMDQQVLQTQHKRIRTLESRVGNWVWEQLFESRVLEILDVIIDSGLCTLKERTEGPSVWSLWVSFGLGVGFPVAANVDCFGDETDDGGGKEEGGHAFPAADGGGDVFGLFLAGGAFATVAVFEAGEDNILVWVFGFVFGFGFGGLFRVGVGGGGGGFFGSWLGGLLWWDGRLIGVGTALGEDGCSGGWERESGCDVGGAENEWFCG